jgi:PLP dependent protein
MVPEKMQVTAGTFIEERLKTVRDEISKAAEKAGRSPDEITLVAVSKTHPPEAVLAAIRAGATVFGENRVQEAESKILSVGRTAAEWHLIGHLQSNKARKAVALFDVIESIESLELAERVERICHEDGKSIQRALIQVKLGDEVTKAGASVDELGRIADASSQFSCLQITGLMAIPPFSEDPEDVRPYFRRLRELRDNFKERGSFGEAFGELSMGMSHDFSVAIEEGATIIRVGTAIFGERA